MAIIDSKKISDISRGNVEIWAKSPAGQKFSENLRDKWDNMAKENAESIESAIAALPTVEINGKTVTTVKDRIALFRRHFNGYCIESGITHYDSKPGGRVVVMAKISDHTGRLLATGHSETTRGERGFPVEYSETKAIGRALASLGIFGGEYASADEFGLPTKPSTVGSDTGCIEDNSSRLSQQGDRMQEVGTGEQDIQSERSTSSKIAGAILQSVGEKGSVKDLNKLWKLNEPVILTIERSDPIAYDNLKNQFNKKKLELLGNSKFEKDEML